MNARLYQASVHFKSFLFIVAIAIIAFLLYYTQSVVTSLRNEAREILEFYAQFYARAAEEATGAELNFIFEQIIKRTDFPIIQTDATGEPVGWKGIPYDPADTSRANLEKVRDLMEAMKKEIDPIPLKYGDLVLGYLYYGDSQSIRQLQWLPYIEIFIVSLFILIGFLGFNSIRRSEQQFIWVGMAKETAHQLGTPISSLMGWIEVLKSRAANAEASRIVADMQQDVERLDKVAQRFSKIGSSTDMQPQLVDAVVEPVLAYFRRRLPQMGKKVRLHYENRVSEPIPLNAELMEWVLENLIKNALDAIEHPDGEIRILVQPNENRRYRAIIDIIDTGRGMDSRTRKNLFKPGFSTKKRGWGLGLSLARRIVENYHRGKLVVKETQPGKGTTMRILI